MTSRKLSLTLILLVAGLLIGSAILFWSLRWREEVLNSSSEFTLALTEDILGSGRADPLIENAHPSLLTEIRPENLQTYIASIPGRLGPLQAITAISMDSTLPWLPAFSGPVTISYTVALQFANGSAANQVEVQRQGSDWQVRHFVVNSPLLMN